MRRRRDAKYLNRGRTIGSGAVAKPTVTVFAPTLYRAIGERGTRVNGTKRDLRRSRDARHLHGSKTNYSSPVPELPVAVLAPALHRAISERGARETVAHRRPRYRPFVPCALVSDAPDGVAGASDTVFLLRFRSTRRFTS